MSSILSKPAVRILGIAESAAPRATSTIITGIIMRADFIIDGVHWGKATIWGMDASEAVIGIVHRLARQDIGCVMLHGCVVAGYNVIDFQRLHRDTKLPIISVTSEPQEDLQRHLAHTFPEDWETRWATVQHNGVLHPLKLPTGATVYLQIVGIDWESAQSLVKRVTRSGGVPEPVRVARLFARRLTESRSV